MQETVFNVDQYAGIYCKSGQYTATAMKSALYEVSRCHGSAGSQQSRVLGMCLTQPIVESSI